MYCILPGQEQTMLSQHLELLNVEWLKTTQKLTPRNVKIANPA